MIQDAPAPQVEETFHFLAMPPTWVVVVVILPAVVGFAWWAYSGMARLEPRARVVLSTLRGLALALLLLALFQPAFVMVRTTTIRTQAHVLIDDSASMQRKDGYPDAAQHRAMSNASGVAELAATTRSELVQRVLAKPGGLLETLQKNHEVRLYRFVRKPLLMRELAELTARGSRSHIGDALDLHLNETGASNLEAVILVSDGRSNAGIDPVEAAAKFALSDLPIYTLGVGDPNPPRNVRITGPPGPREALCKEEVAFDVTVSAEGLEGRTVAVTLLGARDGGSYQNLTSTSAVLGADGVPVRVRLYTAFEQPGDWSLRFEVASFPDETTVEDNHDIRFLRVNDQRIRVLYLEDVPRYEYRYIQNALKRVDPSIEVQVYLFDASKDFPQEHSEGLEPLRDIPRTRQELFQYHVVLIGDVPPERIAPTEDKRNEWLQMLVEFVEFGGGVGVQWGEVAMPGAYRGTPLEDLLPVVLEDPLDLQQIRVDRVQGFRPLLENPQRPHDVALIKRDPESNAALWRDGFAPIILYHPVKQAKAGAEVILRHPTEANRYGKRVLAVAGYYPHGRTFFLGIDTVWKMMNLYGEKYYDTFWRNVVRYLAQGRLRRQDDRVDLRLDKVIVETGEQVRATLELRDDELHPSRASEAVVFQRRADGSPQRRTLPAMPGELGRYQTAFTMDEPGAFSFLVYRDDNPAGELLAREDVLVKVPDRELALSSQDQKTLESIASASRGGNYHFLGDVDQLTQELGNRKPYRREELDRQTRPAWDRLSTLLAILALLSVEWVLRKRARLV